jgi:3-oxoacyl-[acyl-carrier-protein] synthase-1/3-oxoacyl-[acyl-carrier-protein] synthase II
VVNACASATDALGLAMTWIRRGLVDVAIAGGSDELKRFSYHGFLSLKNMAAGRCKPFDRRRDGLNLGEGAGVVVLESEDHAAARGARSLGSVEGYGAAGDAHHATSPHPEGRGLRQAIAAALESAGLTAGDIGLINGHGTATLDNDRVEGTVLADLFPETTIVSTKGYTGHMLGAAGTVEAIIALAHLESGRVPATAGFEEFDPECGIRPTTTGVEVDARHALSTSLAFGGTNSVLVLGRAT